MENKKEFCIYTRYGNGKPFVIHYFDNILNAKLKLYEMISLNEERGRAYFVDNDFFENKYSICEKINYYCIKERNVTEFKKYSELENNLKQKDNEKIILLEDFKKRKELKRQETSSDKVII